MHVPFWVCRIHARRPSAARCQNNIIRPSRVLSTIFPVASEKVHRTICLPLLCGGHWTARPCVRSINVSGVGQKLTNLIPTVSEPPRSRLWLLALMLLFLCRYPLPLRFFLSTLLVLPLLLFKATLKYFGCLRAANYPFLSLLWPPLILPLVPRTPLQDFGTTL